MAYLLLVLTTLFWSGNFVVARAMHLDIPPISMAFYRWLGASLILLPLVWPHLRGQGALLRQHWRVLLLLAILSVANYNTFIYLGLQSTTATNAALLQSAVPVVILLLSWGLLRQPVRGLQLAGVGCSLAGVGLIVTQGNPALVLELALNRGDLWILGAVLTWSLYSVLLKYRPEGLNNYAFLGITVVVGTLALLPFFVWEYRQVGGFAVTAPTLVTLGYMALFPSVLAYFFWNRGVAELGAARAGLFIHLMPVFGLLLSMIFLGERARPFHLLGITLILTGIYLATRRRSVPPTLDEKA